MATVIGDAKIVLKIETKEAEEALEKYRKRKPGAAGGGGNGSPSVPPGPGDSDEPGEDRSGGVNPALLAAAARIPGLLRSGVMNIVGWQGIKSVSGKFAGFFRPGGGPDVVSKFDAAMQTGYDELNKRMLEVEAGTKLLYSMIKETGLLSLLGMHSEAMTDLATIGASAAAAGDPTGPWAKRPEVLAKLALQMYLGNLDIQHAKDSENIMIERIQLGLVGKAARNVAEAMKANAKKE